MTSPGSDWSQRRGCPSTEPQEHQGRDVREVRQNQQRAWWRAVRKDKQTVVSEANQRCFKKEEVTQLANANAEGVG